FDSLAVGSYYVVFNKNTAVNGANYVPTKEDVNANANDADDSDANLTGQTEPTGFLTSGQKNLTLDAGFYLPVTVGDTAFVDNDFDGLQEAGDQGLAGITVTLYNAATNAVVTTNAYGLPVVPQITDATGKYLFDSLAIGNYYVVFNKNTAVNGTNYVPTKEDVNANANDADDSDANPAGQTEPTGFLSSGQSNLTLDAGFYLPVTVGDTAFVDNDFDGLQEPGDQGLAGVTVTLYNAVTNAVVTTNAYGLPVVPQITDATGKYLFDSLAIGNYYVVFNKNTAVNGANYVPTKEDVNANANDADDSDANPAGQTEPTGFLTSGQKNLTLDAGFYLPVTVGDTAFVDNDGNGLQDPTDQGFPGVTVTLYNAINNTVVTTNAYGLPVVPQVTDANGKYLFDSLAVGNYYVVFNKNTAVNGANYVPTKEDVNANANDLDDSDANPAGQTDPTGLLTSGQRNLTLDAGFYLPVVVGDTAFVDNDRDGLQEAGDQGLAGVTVTLFNANGTPVTLDATGMPYTNTTSTGNNGSYLFTNLPPGSYYVVFDKSTAINGANYAPTIQNVNSNGNDADDSDANLTTGRTAATPFLTSGQRDLTLDAGFYLPVTVGDTAFVDNNFNGLQDPNDQGLAGVTVTLYDALTNTVVTTNAYGLPVVPQVTDANGKYLFDSLAVGNYYVVFNKNTAVNGANYVPTKEDVNANANDADDSDANPTGQTDPTGLLTSGQRNLTLDAGFYLPVSVGDTAFVDKNGNGLQDPTDSGLPGVTVTLYNAVTNTPVTTNAYGLPVVPQVTDANGKYLFDSLAVGSYYVVFNVTTAVNGNLYSSTEPNVGNNDSKDSDADPFTGRTPATPLLTSGQSNTTLDAGYVLCAPISCINVQVKLGNNCEVLITPEMVLVGTTNYPSAAGFTFLVADMNGRPIPGNLVTGQYAGMRLRYSIQRNGCTDILCWGEILVEDGSRPRIARTSFTPNPVYCFDANFILNNPKTIGELGVKPSPRQIPAGTIVSGGNLNDEVLNLGIAEFFYCDPTCKVSVKWSDRLEVYDCDSINATGTWGRIYRSWVATSCNGMIKDTVQVIVLKRPALGAFAFTGKGKKDPAAPAYDWTVTYNTCSPDKALIKKEDWMPRINSTFHMLPDLDRRFFLDQVECNYSVQIKDTEFPICNGKGLKIDREIYVFDWCKGGIVDTFHVLIKIGDFEAPTYTLAHHAPFEISTGPMDCTAAFPVTVAGIKSAFGVEIKDNCNLANASVTVWTKDRYVKGILVAQNTWDQVEYAITNGMMIGVPIGKHRMKIEAFDGCYNASDYTFDFEVKDKIAP
ncbi:SdrD B-like domain-containing protein, partial [Haliscomenobacter sp.]|uniref:SdrD B-like domain-containing protein n=1 Tax=Haliscomenobacter sp. TaxID=2717303 RepID=UPI003364F245